MRQITVLGATGSIGISTLDVMARHPDRFQAFALSAHRQLDRLVELCVRHRPRYAAVAEAEQVAAVEAQLRAQGCSTEVIAGASALERIASAPEVDMVMAAIVGAAGLPSAVAAARAGKTILLANKESLVMAGEVFLRACREANAAVLPIDSEHNAIFQCLPIAGMNTASARGVRRLLLTASGGPFRQASLQTIESATPEQAVAHPKWSMGRKISVDSATMMNKGLELIEAHYLFGLPAEAIEIVVHPQSIIHSMVEYVDGSVLAQLGNPDMRTPIAHALGFPDRIDSGVSPLELTQVGRLEFEPPDPVRFPCIRLARAALLHGGGAACVLNAANEISVAAFLNRQIGFGDIARVNERVVDGMAGCEAGHDLESVIELDRYARERARSIVASLTK